MPRTIHLAITSNGRRPAHQAVFVPTGDAGAVGKVIHVTGNAATGFFLEIKRNYDLEATARKYLLIPLAQIDERFVRDTVGNGEPGVDTTARDRLESAAIVAVPPGRSANPFDSSVCLDFGIVATTNSFV